MVVHAKGVGLYMVVHAEGVGLCMVVHAEGVGLCMVVHAKGVGLCMVVYMFDVLNLFLVRAQKPCDSSFNHLGSIDTK